MSNCTTFANLLGALAKHYNLVLFDNCGWGLNTRLSESDGMTSKDAAFNWLKTFICRAIDGMDLPEKFLLAGHSYGGWLVYLYATQRP